MTKQRIWVNPGLYVCLAAITLIFSCSVKRSVKTVYSEHNWEVKAWFNSENADWNIPLDDVTIITPIAVEKSITANQLEMIVVTYRLKNMEQILFLRQKLQEKGHVKTIIVINHYGVSR